MFEVCLQPIKLTPGLYILATPIGNYKDISLRSIEYILSADYIACEDTRVFGSLCKSLGIQAKKLITYHKHNEKNSTKGIIELIEKQKSVILLSDAGTINISDPGFNILSAVYNKNLFVTSLPGPSALITSLSLCPYSSPFLFWGFCDKSESKLLTWLKQILEMPFLHICYESPNRLLKHIEQTSLISPNKNLFIAKDLSKEFEEKYYDTAENLFFLFKSEKIKGEYIISHFPLEKNQDLSLAIGKDTSDIESEIESEIKNLIKNNATKKDILQKIKTKHNLTRDTAYNLIEKIKRQLKGM